MKTTIDGLSINIQQYGEQGKPKLLFLHGWGANLKSFNYLYKYFSQNYYITGFDFPGFGDSDEPKEPWGVPEYAAFTKKLIDMFELGDAVMLAHSFGGRVLIYLAGNNLISPPKMVFMDAAGIRPKRGLDYYLRVYTYKAIKKIASLALVDKLFKEEMEAIKSKFGSDDYKNSSGIIRQIFVKTVNLDLTGYLSKIQTNTLLIWGENDDATPLSDGRLMEKLIPNSGLVVLKNAGHFSFLDKPFETNAIIESFLKS